MSVLRTNGPLVFIVSQQCSLLLFWLSFLLNNAHQCSSGFHFLLTGEAATQIDFILYRRSFRKQVSNVKVVIGEECASQHRLLIGDFKVSNPPQPKRKFVPHIKVWKLKDPQKRVELSEVFKAKTQSHLSQTCTVNERWTSLKDNLLQATKEVCGVSSNHPWRKQTWWWNKQVKEAVYK